MGQSERATFKMGHDLQNFQKDRPLRVKLSFDSAKEYRPLWFQLWFDSVILRRSVVHDLSWNQWPSISFPTNDRPFQFWLIFETLKKHFRLLSQVKNKNRKIFCPPMFVSTGPLFTTSLSSSSTLIIHLINRLERTRLWIKIYDIHRKIKILKIWEIWKIRNFGEIRKLKQWRINFDNMDHVLWNIFYERGHKSFIFSRISELEPGIQGPRTVSSSSAKFRPNPPDRENPKHYLLWF